MKLSQISSAMSTYSNSIAFGGECDAWQDFVEDSHQLYGMSSWGDEDPEVTQAFADYWLDVADGISSDYDNNGARTEA